MRTRSQSRRFAVISSLTAAGLLLAACGGDEGDGGDGDGEGDAGAAAGGTMVFGASADPVILDGALVSDGESTRPINQIFEGLVTTEPGGTETVPALAESWEASEDGLEWTFTLREGVTFHDGEPFNAEAVCFNFDRWYNFAGVLQSPAASYYWGTVMGGFANNEDPALGESLYVSCEASDDRPPSSPSAGRRRRSCRRWPCPRSRWPAPRRWRRATPTLSAAPARHRCTTARSATRTRSAPARSSSTPGSAEPS